MVLLYGAYAFGVAPLLEEPPLVISKETDPPIERPRPNESAIGLRNQELAKLFEPGSWELDNPKTLETEHGLVLIKDYKNLSDGRLELKPCTLVFYMEGAPAAPGQAPTRRPLVMRVPEGAVLQFDEPLDLASAQFGKLLGGRLDGDITIFSPPSAPGAHDNIRIATRNLQIDYERAFTPHDVEFQYGKSFGRGRDLTIRLLPSAKGTAGTKAAFGGLKSLELARLDRLHLETSSGGLFPSHAKPASVVPSTGIAQHPSRSAEKPADPPLEVRCQGPLRFDFLERRIELVDRVEVVRVRPLEPEDRLTCELLLLDFSEVVPVASALVEQSAPTMNREPLAENAAGLQPTDTAASPGATPKKSSSMSQQLERFFASGRPVILESPVTGTVVTAAELEYLPAAGRVAVRPDRSTPSVTLRHLGNQLDAVQVEYELSPTRQIGRLWAKGPGRVKREIVDPRAPQTPPRALCAYWQTELRLRPQENQHVLSLMGGARLEDPLMGMFQSDELHLWMFEVAPAEAPPTQTKQAGPSLALMPDRILASGNVTLVSPQLDAHTKRLECWFAHDVPLPKTVAPPPHGGPIADGRMPPIGPEPPGPGAAPPGAVLQKFRVRGELVQAQVRMAGEEPLLEDLALQGNVELDEVATAKPDDVPMKLRGDAVQLRGGLERAKLEVMGRPASVSARGLSLVGGVIHFDRAVGRMWIDGPGKATMPMPQSKLGAPVDPMAEASEKPEPVDVTWQENMTFDGTRVTMRGAVEARTNVVLATGATLTADLTEPIDFQQLTTKKFSGDLRELSLDGNVYVEHYGFDEYGQQTSLERLRTRKVTANMVEGKFRADGPGWVSSTREQSSITVDPMGAAAVPPPAPAGKSPLAFIRVDYEGQIDGEFARRQVKFSRKVRAIYGPVTAWDQQFDAKSVEQLGERGVLLTSDELTTTEMLARSSTGTPISWIELLASGNVIVEGKQFTARAGRISYTSEKELLIVEGSGRSDAEWWWREDTGLRTAYNVARKFMYSRKTDFLDVEGGKVLDVQQLQGAGKEIPSILRR